MKKNLLTAASFFVLGAFLMSPLYAMDEEKRNVPKPRTHFFMSDSEHFNESQTQKIFFQKVYEDLQKVVDGLKDDAIFGDYGPLILSCIGSQGYNEKVDEYIEILQSKWDKDPEVRFFTSFLKEMEEFEDFSYNLVEQAKTMQIEHTCSFTQILKIFVLEDFRNIKNLEIEFCEKYSRERLDSELRLIRTIYESLANASEEDLSSDEMSKR